MPGSRGSLALAAARLAGARTAGVVVSDAERDMLRSAGLADHVAVADARDPVAVSSAVAGALGGPADGDRGVRGRAGLRARRDPVHRRTAAR